MDVSFFLFLPLSLKSILKDYIKKVEEDLEVQTSSYKISHRDKIYDSGNIVNNVIITGYSDRWYWTYCYGHFARYINIELLHCTPETDITLYVNCNFKKDYW